MARDAGPTRGRAGHDYPVAIHGRHADSGCQTARPRRRCGSSTPWWARIAPRASDP